MLDAFEAGGDFHSRTAMNMYSYVREAVDKKEVLLEWHPLPGEDKPPVPLLKDVYASERRKAKMLNFLIAYGKTAVGLARDWKVHDEVILEGPTESAEIAKAIVVDCMSKPFNGKNILTVGLSVDIDNGLLASVGQNLSWSFKGKEKIWLKFRSLSFLEIPTS